jgi:cytoskeletal protein RodZ
MLKSCIRYAAIVLILLLILTGCGGGDGEKKSESPSDTASVSSEDSSTPTDSESVEPSDSESVEPSDSESAEPSDSESAEPSESSSTSPSKSTDPDQKKFDGYLVDVKTAKAGKDRDGNNMKEHPELYKVSYMKEASHVASGYGLYIMENGKYKFYKFDSAGNKQVKRYIIDKTKKDDHLRVAVRGVLTEDNIIAVKLVMDYK